MKRYIRVHHHIPTGKAAVYVAEDDIQFQYILTKLLLTRDNSVLVPVNIIESVTELEIPHRISVSPIETSSGVFIIQYIEKQKSLIIRKSGE